MVTARSELATKLTRQRSFLIGLAVFLTCAIVLSAYLYYINEVRTLRKNIKSELHALAAFKSSRLTRWYLDEVDDVENLSQGLPNEHLIKFLSGAAGEDSLRIHRQLESIRLLHGYQQVMLISASGIIRIQSGEHPETLSNEMLEKIRISMTTGLPVATEIYVSADQNTPRMDFIAQLPGGAPFTGVFLVCSFDSIDEIAESLKRTSLAVRPIYAELLSITEDRAILLSDSIQPTLTVFSVKGLCAPPTSIICRHLKGASGFIEGQDRFGRPVFANVRQVSETPFHLLIKTDKELVFVDMYAELWLSGALVFLLLLTLGVGLALYYNLQKKKVFEALWKADEEFRITLYCIAEAVIITDSQGNIRYLNNSAQILLGKDEPAARGMALSDILMLQGGTVGDLLDASGPQSPPQQNSLSRHDTMVVINSNSRRIPVLLSASPIYNMRKDHIGTVLVIHDQTEARARQVMLEDSERKYRGLFEATAEGIALFQMIYNSASELSELRCFEINQQFSVLFALEQNDFTSSKGQDILAEQTTILLPLCKRVLESKTPVISEMFVQNIQRHFVVTVYSPEPGRVAAVYHDITSRINAEHALKAKVEELDRFHRLTIDRELRLIDLKQEVNALLRESGKPEKYHTN